MPTAPFARYVGQGLKPAKNPQYWMTDAKKFAPGVYVPGQVLGQNATITGANDVQTLTISATGGTFILMDPTSGYITAALAYNITAAALQLVLENAYGAGNVAVTGGPGATAALVITFQNYAGNMPQAPIVVYANNVTGGGGTVANVHTTTGRVVGGTVDKYNDANSDGTNVARYVNLLDLTVDNNGRHRSGGGEWGSRQLSAPVLTAGFVRTADLTGLDAAAIADFGVITDGSASNLSSTGTILKVN